MKRIIRGSDGWYLQGFATQAGRVLLDYTQDRSDAMRFRKRFFAFSMRHFLRDAGWKCSVYKLRGGK